MASLADYFKQQHTLLISMAAELQYIIEQIESGKTQITIQSSTSVQQPLQTTNKSSQKPGQCNGTLVKGGRCSRGTSGATAGEFDGLRYCGTHLSKAIGNGGNSNTSTKTTQTTQKIKCIGELKNGKGRCTAQVSKDIPDKFSQKFCKRHYNTYMKVDDAEKQAHIDTLNTKWNIPTKTWYQDGFAISTMNTPDGTIIFSSKDPEGEGEIIWNKKDDGTFSDPQLHKNDDSLIQGSIVDGKFVPNIDDDDDDVIIDHDDDDDDDDDFDD